MAVVSKVGPRTQQSASPELERNDIVGSTLDLLNQTPWGGAQCCVLQPPLQVTPVLVIFEDMLGNKENWFCCHLCHLL